MFKPHFRAHAGEKHSKIGEIRINYTYHMRIAISAVFVALVVVLAICTFLCRKSKKRISTSVSLLIFSLIPPVIGNLFLIASPNEVLSTIGCYIYFLGMDLVMFSMFRFMFDYCEIDFHRKLIKSIVYSILLVDMIQLTLNAFFHHAFTMVIISENGADFYNFVAHWGQTIHRVVDYGILAAIMIVFLVKTIISPRVYAERYLVILLAMVAVGAWQTVNIFTRSAVNVSMIGYGVYGVLIFFLSIYYRPLRLLDRMLGVIAARMPEAIFFFDRNGSCVWLNDRAAALLGIEKDRLDHVRELLGDKLGDYQKDGDDWENTVSFGEGDDMVSYVVEKHNVTDNHNRIVGFYLNIRDNSEDQRKLQKETFNATHDKLTNIYNRAGYDEKMESIDLSKCFLLIIDLDAFKEANDQYGHTTGDKVLIKVAETIKKHFRAEDYICRLGGDEFAVIIPDVEGDISNDVGQRVQRINEELSDLGEGLPKITISAGGAYGKDAENAYELFNNADHAMYKTKFGGKAGFSLFEKR